MDFGEAPRGRYKALLNQAIADLADDPARNGVKAIDEVRPGYFIYHVRWAKASMAGPSVRQPRHSLVFSIDGEGVVVVAAVIHDRELPARHLGV